MKTRMYAAVAVLVLAALGLAGCGGQPGPTGVTHLPGQTAVAAGSSEPAPPQAVVDAARDTRQSGRIVGPVEWVRTTLQVAEHLTSRGPSVPVADDVPVYVVQVHGQFRLESAPRPSGAASPEGTVLLLYLPVTPDPAAGNSGMRLSSVAADLSTVGTVRTFDLP